MGATGAMSPDMNIPAIPLHTKNELIFGRERWKWVVSAAKGLVSATDAHLRWLIVRGGSAEFLRVAQHKFLAFEPAIKFTEDELRWIFQVLEVSIPERFREAEMAKEIERFQRKELTDKQLKNGAGEGPTGHDGPSEQFGGGITTEFLPERDKSTVH